jgi:hydroxymethylpyrimidine/phosphomethylpyrimidine kinase
MPRRSSPPRYARFETPGGATLSIHSGQPTGPGTVIYFEVDDVDAVVAELQDKGLEFDTQPVDQDWLWREASIMQGRIAAFRRGGLRRSKHAAKTSDPGDAAVGVRFGHRFLFEEARGA